ncbi:MAG: hypothetical protein EA361_04075 [Bacteroidetes bacterium]|nr:MAG: hypothetical protein EA361_04075 [Bacteroidota bacterium]
MTLAIINGSPRGQKSNSKILTEHFLKGYRSKNNQGNVVTSYLVGKEKMQENLEVFKQSEQVIIIFPLYTDCMPGMVKEFFEHLPKNNAESRKDLGFIVQSGFPEAIHSVYLGRYLKKLTQRLGYNYLGTVIKGGVEGIQVMPASMTRKLFDSFRSLGEYYAENGSFSEAIKEKLQGSLRMSKAQQIGFKIVGLTGLPNFYWNSNLKKNGAYQRRNDKPYVAK